MEKTKLNRINELARKSRAEGLSETEKAEQKTLREEYIRTFRASIRGQLDNIRLVEPDGTETPIPKKEKAPQN